MPYVNDSLPVCRQHNKTTGQYELCLTSCNNIIQQQQQQWKQYHNNNNADAAAEHLALTTRLYSAQAQLQWHGRRTQQANVHYK